MSRFRKELKKILINREVDRFRQRTQSPKPKPVKNERSNPTLDEYQKWARDINELIKWIEQAIKNASTRGEFHHLFQRIGFLSIIVGPNHKNLPEFFKFQAKIEAAKSASGKKLTTDDQDEAFRIGQAWAELIKRRSDNEDKPPPAKQPPTNFR